MKIKVKNEIKKRKEIRRILTTIQKNIEKLSKLTRGTYFEELNKIDSTVMALLFDTHLTIGLLKDKE